MKLVFHLVLMLLASAAISLAQQSVSAGGRWIRITEPAKGTARSPVTFLLAADDANGDRHPTISITCTETSKPPIVQYDADVQLGPTVKDPLNYYAPSIRAQIKVDDEKIYKALWNVELTLQQNQKRAILDHRTLHHLLTGSNLRVRFSDRYDESYLDEYTLTGLNVNDLLETCGSKWFGKGELGGAKEMAAQKR